MKVSFFGDRGFYPHQLFLSAPDNSSSNSLEITESTPTVLSYGDVIETTNKELKRLGWTKEKGIQYLLDTYNKKSRQLLSDEQLLEFVAYLQSLPTPNLYVGDCG